MKTHEICIVGCGAIGSLFAAHLARAGEVEVFAFDVARRPRRRHPAARPAPLRRGRLHRAPARDHRCRRDSALRLRHCRDQEHAHAPAPSRQPRASSTTTAPSARCRTASATKRSSPSTCATSFAAPRFPPDTSIEPGHVGFDIQRRHLDRPVRADRHADGAVDGTRRPDHARRHEHHRPGRRARRAVDQADLQRRHQSRRRAHATASRRGDVLPADRRTVRRAH